MDALGAASAVAYYPAMHLGLGSVMSATAMNVVMLVSFGVFSWLSWSDLAPEGDDYDLEYSCSPPAFVDSRNWCHTVNFAVVGTAGSGKSSLVNVLRGLGPRDPGAAAVGLDASTPEPRFYSMAAAPVTKDAHVGLEPNVLDIGAALPEQVADGAAEAMSFLAGAKLAGDFEKKGTIRLWEMPGFDPGTHTPESCCSEFGLAYFDAVLIVYSDRLTDFELGLLAKLELNMRVPTFLVRSQVDVDVENEQVDHGQLEEETLCKLRGEAVVKGATSMYLVDNTTPEKFDLPQLSMSISKIAKARARALAETECPICFENFDKGQECRICHWCGNIVCGNCARKLRRPQGEVTCPFCRRCTFLFKPQAPSGQGGFWASLFSRT